MWVLLAGLVFATPAGAQQNSPQANAPQENAAPANAASREAGRVPAVPDAGAVHRLIETLEDEGKRDRLITDLRTLLPLTEPDDTANPAKNNPAKDNPPEDNAKNSAAPGPPALSTLMSAGQQPFAAIAEAHIGQMLLLVDRVSAAVAALVGFPEWVIHQFDDRARRKFWVEVGLAGIAFPVLVALLARLGFAGLARRPVRHLRRVKPKQKIGERTVAALFHSLLEASAVIVVLMAGYMALALVERSEAAADVASFVILAIAIHTGVGVVARLILSPYAEALRPVPLRSRTAAFLYLWIIRLSTVAVIGYVLTGIAQPLGASAGGEVAIRIIGALIFAALTLILIIQARDQLAGAIRGQNGGPMRRRFADLWHVLAILYVLMVFGIFVSGGLGGFITLLRASSVTALAMLGAGFGSYLFERASRKLFDFDPELDRRFPGLRERSTLYRPLMRRAIDAILFAGAILIALDAWGVDPVGALPPTFVLALLQSAGVVVIVLLLCVLAWEFSSSKIARLLAETLPDGSPRLTSARAKTLLPLLRRVIMAALLIFGGLIVLSELGVNIAPLLAGAGGIGLAVGFGAQTLVRDVITGLFILIENTVSVGDVVTVGDHTGVVEDISIRTIRLRDLQGALYVVPFGDVTTVQNLTRGYAYALVDIGVAYREDTDRVCAILAEIGVELRADADWSDNILEPIEILGVNELAASAVIIRCRMKTPPLFQWAVRRELFRRIKKRFDALGIEIPFPQSTLWFGETPPATGGAAAQQAAITSKM